MQYLELLEGENSESKDSYLWPSTNVGDFQKGIKRKFGASDYDLKYGPKYQYFSLNKVLKNFFSLFSLLLYFLHHLRPWPGRFR